MAVDKGNINVLREHIHTHTHTDSIHTCIPRQTPTQSVYLVVSSAHTLYALYHLYRSLFLCISTSSLAWSCSRFHWSAEPLLNQTGIQRMQCTKYTLFKLIKPLSILNLHRILAPASAACGEKGLGFSQFRLNKLMATLRSHAGIPRYSLFIDSKPISWFQTKPLAVRAK